MHQSHIDQLFDITALDEFPAGHPFWLVVRSGVYCRTRIGHLDIAVPARD